MKVTRQARPNEFPFPIKKAGREANALTWVRNHSSYLTVGGILNYLQIAGIYVRGIILNLMVLAPALLIAAAAIGSCHHVLLNHPFGATLTGVIAFMVAIVVFLADGPNRLIQTVSARLRGVPEHEGSVVRMARERFIAWTLLASTSERSRDRSVVWQR